MPFSYWFVSACVQDEKNEQAKSFQEQIENKVIFLNQLSQAYNYKSQFDVEKQNKLNPVSVEKPNGDHSVILNPIRAETRLRSQSAPNLSEFFLAKNTSTPNSANEVVSVFAPK